MGGFSTGKKFSKALAEARQVKHTQTDDIDRIKAFILDHTAFEVTNTTLKHGSVLIVKAIRKGSDM